MPTKVLAIDLIQVLGSVQPRQTLNEDAIADYAEHYSPSDNGKAPLPPLRVFHDGNRYILSRGFHRHTAAIRATRKDLECEILDGTERDAILDAMQDNAEHGVRLTPADKRKAVNRLLDDSEWGKLGQAKVAEMANVSLGLVRSIVAERKAAVTGGKLYSFKPESSSLSRSKQGVKGGIKAAGAEPPPINGANEKAKMKFPDGAALGVLCPNCLDMDRSVDWYYEDACAFCQQPITEPSEEGRPSVSSQLRSRGDADYGKCPNCAGTKWKAGEDGVRCAKCKQPHGEATGGTDENRIKDQRSKTVKTAEALMRAFDDLHTLLPRAEHAEAIDGCKRLLKVAKGWK